MAYLGRPGATAPLTSADIPDDSITAAKIVDGAIDFQDEIGFLENKATTQNLSGTYSTERMYLNDSYTLTGDVTVTGHLALGTVADADVVITQDSTERTITGSGTLESGDLLHRAEDSTDLTGMTGTIGSGVTFPTGCVINTVQTATTSTISTGSTSYAATSLMTTLPSIGSASNKILATLSGGSGGHGNIRTYVKLMESINGGTYSDISGAETNNKFVSGEHQGPFSMNYLFTPNGGSGTTNSVAVRVSIKTSSGTSYLNNSSALLTLTLQEIQG